MNDGSTDCPICDEGPTDVAAELSQSWLTIPPMTPLPGYVCLVSKRHVREPFQLPPQERDGFWRDVDDVARALDEAFQPDKLNYEIHGNTIPHLHLHLFPRWRGDPFDGRPIDGSMATDRTDEDRRSLEAVVRRLDLG